VSWLNNLLHASFTLQVTFISKMTLHNPNYSPILFEDWTLGTFRACYSAHYVGILYVVYICKQVPTVSSVSSSWESGLRGKSRAFARQLGLTYYAHRPQVVVVVVDRVRLRLWSEVTIESIVHLPDDIWVWRTTVESCRQGKTPDLSTRALSQFKQQKHIVPKREEYGEENAETCLRSISSIP